MIDSRLWSCRAASFSFHFVVFGSVGKTEDKTLVWGGIKVWKRTKNNIERTDERRQMRNQKDFIVVAPNPRFCVFLLSFILSSRQILSDRAALVLIQSAENVIINCNSSAINYSSMFVLLIFCLSPVCVCVRACMRACVREKVGGSATYPIIIFCLSSKVFWENINYVFNKGQRLNRPPWPQPHLPWHTHTYTHIFDELNE